MSLNTTLLILILFYRKISVGQGWKYTTTLRWHEKQIKGMDLRLLKISHFRARTAGKFRQRDVFQNQILRDDAR